MKLSYILALCFAFILVAYFAIGVSTKSAASDTSDEVDPRTLSLREQQTQANIPVDVTAYYSSAELHPIIIQLRGATAPSKVVTVRAETQGMVAKASIAEGSTVKKGTALCVLDKAARNAQLAEAKATREARRLDFEASQKLTEKGWRTPSHLASAKAALDAASAMVEQAEIELGKTVIRAPFTGIFETREAEIGDFLSPGAACGRMVTLSPLKAVGNAPEALGGVIRKGQEARIDLKSGHQLFGEVTYVASLADPATRTFKVEVDVANQDNAIPAGITAEIYFITSEVMAHGIDPGVIVIDSEGRLGVKVISNDRAHFVPVNIIHDTPKKIWATGLTDEALVIAAGQNMVTDESLLNVNILSQAVSGEAG